MIALSTDTLGRSRRHAAALLLATVLTACGGAANQGATVTSDAMTSTLTSATSANTTATAAVANKPTAVATAAQPPIPSPQATATTAATATAVPTPPPALTASPTAAPRTEGQRLLAGLRRGGYVIFIRHAATDFAQADSDRQNLDNCQTQRNLTAQGRADAERIGEGVRLLRVPIGQVLASPYCRTRETAQLAFGRYEATRDLLALPSARDEADRQALVDAFARLLATTPPAGANTVLVGHDFSIQAVANLTIAEGEAAIFEPRGAEGFRLVGRVPHYKWAELEYARRGGPSSESCARSWGARLGS